MQTFSELWLIYWAKNTLFFVCFSKIDIRTHSMMCVIYMYPIHTCLHFSILNTHWAVKIITMVYGNFSQIFHIVEKILRETPKGKTTLVSTRSMGSFFFQFMFDFFLLPMINVNYFFSLNMCTNTHSFKKKKHDIVLLVRGCRNILDLMK